MKYLRSRGSVALLASVLCTIPSLAAADSLLMSRGTASELLHTIDVELEPGVAQLKVRRTFVNRSRTSADLTVLLQLPDEGVITDLSIDAGEVEAQYRGFDEAALLLPSMPARAKRTVEYTVEVPLVSSEGWASIRMDLEEREQQELAELIVRHEGVALEPEFHRFWRAYRVPAPTPAEGQLRWGAFVSAQGPIWRVELDAPHTLSQRPDAQQVCFVIDRSRSQTRLGVERQLRILARWARAQPGARYQVIASARTAEPLFDAPVGANELLALTADDPRLALENGSELGAALELATEALADTSGAAQLVVLGDAELASRLTLERLQSTLAGLSPTTTVHLLISEGRQTYGAIQTRADQHPLAQLALAHGGVPMQVLVPDDYPDPEGLIIANLFRPRRIDRLALELDGQRGDERSPLWEQQGKMVHELAVAMPESIAAVGWVWAQPWRLAGTRSAAVDRRAAVFAASFLDQKLEAATLEQIGRTYTVATRETALRAKRGKLAVVSPTPLDLDEGGGGGLFGTGRGGGEPPAIDQLESAQLLASFGPGIDACVEQRRGPADQLTLRVETTWDEIVDVVVEGGDASTRECVAATVWQTSLDDGYTERRAAASLVVELPMRAEQAEQPPAIEPNPRGCRLTTESGLGSSIVLLALLGLGRRRRD